jgi:hypothetical protein
LINLVDIVEMIGDRLTDIDVTLARSASSDPDTVELRKLRIRLDGQQQLLSKRAFDENTAQFQEAAEALSVVNDSIGDNIRSIDRMATVIDDVTRLLDSVTNLVTTAGKLL